MSDMETATTRDGFSNGGSSANETLRPVGSAHATTSTEATMDISQITDCWVTPGSSDNGNILWVSLGANDTIVGGYRSLDDALNEGRRLGWEPTVEEA